MSTSNTTINEEIYELYWEGPFNRKQFNNELKRKKAPGAWTLYAMCDDHPLYGVNALTYVGKAVKQSMQKRVTQHDWWANQVYVASVYKFIDWNKSNDEWSYSGAIVGEENDVVISKIEDLLIFSMAPAYNQRNKNTANNSKLVRIFNTGNHNQLPGEISGFYQTEHVPDPDALDKE